MSQGCHQSLHSQRNAHLDNLFRHQISLPPPSFYTAGEVNICSTKLLDCLLADYIILSFNINYPAILVDGSSGTRNIW